MDTKFLKDMINLYPLQKTLCFELRRIDKTGKMAELEDLGSDELEALLDKTLENFDNNKIVEHAEKKLEHLEEIKKLLDSIHIDIIEDSLKKLSSDEKFNEFINKYADLRNSISENLKKKKENKKSFLYKNITKDIKDKNNQIQKNSYDIFSTIRKKFQNHKKYEDIFSDKKMELLEEKYPQKKEIISYFKSFESYFKGYDKRLKYLYEDDLYLYEDKEYQNEHKRRYTAYKSIPYLLTNYNLPIFSKNAEILEEIYNRYILDRSKNRYISVKLNDLLIQHKNIRDISKFSKYLTKSDIKDYNDIIKKINQEFTNYNYNKDKEHYKFSHLGFLKNVVDLDQDTDILRKIYDDKELIEIIKKFISEDNFKEFKLVFKNMDKKYNLDKIYFKNGSYLMDTLHLNEDRKINESYIQLSKLKEQKACEKISNRANELFNNFNELLNNDPTLKRVLKAKYEPNMRSLGRKVKTIKVDDKEIKKNDELDSIKKFLDSIKEISAFVSCFMPKKSEDRYLTDFDKINFDIYNRINHERLAKIDQIYNHVKAYFTLKNFSTRKIRLNFDIDSFLESWDIDHIDSYLGTILIKEEDGEKKYFLGIINQKKFSEFEYVDEQEENAYKQMICKYVKNSNDESAEDEIKRYRVVKFRKISKDSIDEMVASDKLYLFQFYNKYFSKFSKINKNLNAIYWDNIFDDYNIKNNIFTINGEAKLFYRPKSLPWKITHKANEPIKNKDNPEETSTFDYDLIKDKRYTENKLMVHIPITINCNSQDIDQQALNKKVLEKIKDSNDINILAISRSRDDLLHATVMDLNGKIKESISLSTITSNGYDKDKKDNKVFEKDYNALVNKKEQEKIDANSSNNTLKEWQSEKSIKDFLTGYISKVVNRIVNIVKENKENKEKIISVIVFEEARAKQLRGVKIEEALYRDLIKAIISKFSFLANKKESSSQFGSTFNAYQLSYYEKEEEKELEKIRKEKIEKDKSNGKKGKANKNAQEETIIQNGIVFHHIPTKFTSDIDVDTGFINCFWLRDDISVKNLKEFINTFNKITLYPEKEIYKLKDNKEESNSEENSTVKNCYAFEFEYEKFKNCTESVSKKIKGKDVNFDRQKFLSNDLLKNIKNDKFFKQTWTLYSCVKRIEEKDNEFKNIDISEEFTSLFKQYGIIDTEEIEISDSVLRKCKIVIAHNNFKIDMEDIKTILQNLKNSDSFKGEFEKADKSKVFELLKKHHVLNVKAIDELSNNNKDNTSVYNVIRELFEIIDEYKVTFFKIKEIKDVISKFLSEEGEDRVEFCKEFVRLFNLMLRMRNYDKTNDFEYVLSPIGKEENEVLKFFNSNSDENSSQNIAKKGLLLVKKIRNGNFNLEVTDEEWIESVIGDKFK